MSCRCCARQGGRRAEGLTAQLMQDAVQPFQPEGFITPMAAVAGAVAQTVLAAMANVKLDRVTINNGGDIALRLAPGQRVTIGLAARPEELRLYGQLLITADQPTRGVATSGFGGRSDTFGIADAVTILAPTAAMADAAASVVANAVDLPGHPAIRRGPSQRAQSDLGDRLVTRAVGPLAPDEIAAALARGAARARALAARGLLHAAALHLRGATPVGAGRGTVYTVPHHRYQRPGRMSQELTALPYVLEENIGFLLRQAGQRHLAIFAEHMPEQLTATQFAALSKIREIGPCSQNRLGRLTAMDAATIKGVVDRLTARGLTQSKPDPEDGRMHLISLTAAGRDLADTVVPVALTITERTLAPLTPSEQKTLLGLLRRLTGA